MIDDKEHTDLIFELTNLPPEDSINHAFQVRDLLNKKSIRKKLKRVFEEESLDPSVRFNAFYGTLVCLWRDKDFLEYRNLIDMYEHAFKNFKLFNTFRSQYFSSIGSSESHILNALDYAKKAKEDLPHLPNVIHLYCYLVAQLNELNENVNRKMLIEAERDMDRIIATAKRYYPKYLVTKARIMALLDKFEEAKDLIRKAIESESSESNNYAIRLAEYQEVRIRIGYIEHSRNLDKKQSNSLRELEEVKLKTVELLGLLAAVIAFLITSTQIAKDLDFKSASKMMIISSAVIMIVFSSYSMVFFRSRIRLAQICILLLGFTVVLVAYYFMN